MKMLMQDGFKQQMDRMDRMDSEIGNLNSKMENAIKQRMDRMDSEIEKIHLKMDAITTLLKQHMHPQDCSMHSGVTKIFPPQPSPNQFTPLTLYCKPTTAGGGWMVFLRRIDNTEDFPNRVWQEYKDGLGDLTGSFWLGLEALHQLTVRPATLRISLEDWDGNTKYAQYTQFSISGEEDGYRLSIGTYSGDVGDSLTYHNGMKFSSIDKDQDMDSRHCSKEFAGAWWYKGCHQSQLTGRYYAGGTHSDYWQGVMWKHWKGRYYSFKRAEMMLLRH